MTTAISFRAPTAWGMSPRTRVGAGEADAEGRTLHGEVVWGLLGLLLLAVVVGFIGSRIGIP